MLDRQTTTRDESASQADVAGAYQVVNEWMIASGVKQRRRMNRLTRRPRPIYPAHSQNNHDHWAIFWREPISAYCPIVSVCVCRSHSNGFRNPHEPKSYE